MTDINAIEAIAAFGLTLFGQFVWKYDIYWDDINPRLAFPMLINATIVGILFYIK